MVQIDKSRVIEIVEFKYCCFSKDAFAIISERVSGKIIMRQKLEFETNHSINIKNMQPGEYELTIIDGAMKYEAGVISKLA